MKIAKEDVEKFRTHLIEEEKEPGTVGLYLSVVGQFMAFLQGQVCQRSVCWRTRRF